MINLFLSFVGLCLSITLLNWKKALSVIIIVGFLQDPIRKLVPGEPVIFTVSAIFLLLLIFIILFLQSIDSNLLEPFENYKSLKNTASFFIILVLIQCCLGYIDYGSLVMTAIGAASYLSIFPALWTSWYFISNHRTILKLLRTYLLCSVIVTSGVYLSFLGFQWAILKQVGKGIFISSRYGNLIAHTGFMRSPEIAAWHIATGACILIFLLLSSQQKSLLYILASTLLLAMIGAGILTGRRKALAEVVVFTIVYVILLLYFQIKNQVKPIILIAFIGTLLALTLFSISPDNVDLGVNPYFERGSSVFMSSEDRLKTLGFGSIGWAINRFGYFGIGAGTAGLGMAHFSGVVEGTGGASEGGLGKIVVELGIPGLILIPVFLFQLAQLAWKNVKLAAQHNLAISSLSIGILSLLIANIPMFISSSLLFGDPFILVVCGCLMGVLLAIPKTIRTSPTYLKQVN